MRDRYKNYFYVTTFATLLVTIVCCAAIYRWWPRIDPGICYLGDCIAFKEDLTKGIGNKSKIVFGGGSGTNCGVSAGDVEKAFGVPSVNMAGSALLEIDYILYRLKRVLEKGDVVILPLEYEHLVYTGKSSPLKMSFVLSCDKQYFLKLPWRSRIEYIFSLMNFVTAREALKRRHARDSKNCRQALNDNGDVTGNAGVAQEFELSPLPLQQGGFIETHGLTLIKEFSRWCKARGIHCYVTYPNMVYLKEYEEKRYHTYFDNLQRYFTSNDIDFIGTPYDFFFPLKLFYDSRYHLNRNGVTLRTRQLIAMMRKMNVVPTAQR
jgi:hypothetical protein